MAPLTLWKVSLRDRHLHKSALTYFHWITSFPSVSLDGETQLAQLAGRPKPVRAAAAACTHSLHTERHRHNGEGTSASLSMEAGTTAG